jgi:GTPase SAR1 family protein
MAEQNVDHIFLGLALRQPQEPPVPWLHLDGLRLEKIPDEVFELTHLEELDLSDNALWTVPDRLWDELPNLRHVVLIGNPLNYLPDRPGLIIDQFAYVKCSRQLSPQNVTLFLDNNVSTEEANYWILDLSTSKNLHGLMLGQWVSLFGQRPVPGLQKILSRLADFDFLRHLSLRGLDLRIVPEGIRRLTGLKYLGLDKLDLKALPDWLGELDLETLLAANNDLRAVPESLSNLGKLRSLNLSQNPLGKIPPWIYDSASLENLHLRGCAITQVPPDILRLPKLKFLDVDQNAIEAPPIEIARNGLDAMRDYWRQRTDTGVDYLCEAKLIILGEAGAGKTSLARKIENRAYELQPDEKTTEGIDVIHYRFPTALRTRDNEEEKIVQREFQVNIWDFGGQEIYHATHQFFLTRRSLYVLVCDERKEDTQFHYWLQVVEMLSDASPLLVVQNERQDRTRDIDLGSLRARFANLRGAISTNLATNRGLEDVIAFIQKELETLPHVGVGLPATWKRVREALERDRRDYITVEEYLHICELHGFTREEDKYQLSGYLHDLGICLHFQDDPLLKKTVVLKPAWGTEAVYRVLDDAEVQAARGTFTRKQLSRIWFEPEYAGMQDELLQLMMKFQLCYALDARHYIAPQLLSSEQPSYPWDLAGGLVVRYEYVFLPKGIVTRFIVAMHRLIAGTTLVWKTGVVLERDGTRAEIIEEYALRRIRVRVSGADPRGLFAIVDEQLERLHASFTRLQYERYLPCPCQECRVKAEPYGFPLDSLVKMAARGQEIQCHDSGEMVDAERLVRDVLPGALRRREHDGPVSAMPLVVPSKPEVFVSYAWTQESNAVVDRLEDALKEHDIRLLRDKKDMRYKDSIRDFMTLVGQGNAVVVVISEKYLKSEKCMFELVEIAKAQNLRERIFPIVLADANIYKAGGRVQYIKYWEKEFEELDDALKTVRADNLSQLHQDLDLYSEIRRLFDGLADTLRDMNALSPDEHDGSGFEELIGRIRAQLAV